VGGTLGIGIRILIVEDCAANATHVPTWPAPERGELRTGEEAARRRTCQRPSRAGDV